MDSEKLEGYCCGDCIFFDHYPKGKKTCKAQGVQDYAVAEKRCFVPDFSKLADNAQALTVFMGALSSFTKQQQKICLALLKQATKSNSKAFPVGSHAYVKVGIGEYVNNYRKVIVAGYLPDGQAVAVSSLDFSNAGAGFTAIVEPDALISVSDGLSRIKALEAEGKIDDPELMAKPVTADDVFEQDEIPTMDTAPDFWFSKREASEKERKYKDTFDRLIDLG